MTNQSYLNSPTYLQSLLNQVVGIWLNSFHIGDNAKVIITENVVSENNNPTISQVASLNTKEERTRFTRHP